MPPNVYQKVYLSCVYVPKPVSLNPSNGGKTLVLQAKNDLNESNAIKQSQTSVSPLVSILLPSIDLERIIVVIDIEMNAPRRTATMSRYPLVDEKGTVFLRFSNLNIGETLLFSFTSENDSPAEIMSSSDDIFLAILSWLSGTILQVSGTNVPSGRYSVAK